MDQLEIRMEAEPKILVGSIMIPVCAKTGMIQGLVPSATAASTCTTAVIIKQAGRWKRTSKKNSTNDGSE